MMTNRQGFSLAELLVGLVVASLLSASIIQVMTVQSRFMSTQEGRSNARAVSRGATGLMLSELRMVQTTGGVVQASRDTISVRMPFRMGMVCANGGSYTIVAFQPVDSVKYAHSMATGNMAGYGWRDANGNLSYVEAAVSMSANGSDPNTCKATGPTAPNMSVPFVNAAEVRRVVPQIGTAYTGMPVFLHSRVTYAFGPSTSVPGRRGLYRTIGSSAPEELVAPFDTAAKFRFFWADSASAKDAPPAVLDDLAGIELFMVGVNERTANPDAAETTPVRTAVFFKN